MVPKNRGLRKVSTGFCLELGGRCGFSDPVGSFSKNVALLAIGFWLGCAVLFGAVVAPTLFNPDVASGLSSSMAGAITGAILRRIHLITYVSIGLATFFLLMCSFGEAKGARGPRWAVLLCLLVLALNAANAEWIHRHLNRIKVDLANAPKTEKAGFHREFMMWHKRSVWVYAATTACGALAAILLVPSVARGQGRRSSR